MSELKDLFNSPSESEKPLQKEKGDKKKDDKSSTDPQTVSGTVPRSAMQSVPQTASQLLGDVVTKQQEPAKKDIVMPSKQDSKSSVPSSAGDLGSLAQPATVAKQITEEEEFGNIPPQKEYGTIYTLYAFKGDGKTYFSMTYPGKKLILSFDRKADPVKRSKFPNDPKIVIKDAIIWMDWSANERLTESADKTFRYVQFILRKIRDGKDEDKPDWIVVDASEEFQKIAELTMRFRNGLAPSEGFANLNLWKERRMFIRQLHQLCLDASKLGVIYTTYIDQHEVIDKTTGQVVERKDVPRWIDAIMTETDVVIRLDSEMDRNGGKKFWALVESSKTDIPTGIRVNVTDRGFAAVEEEKKPKSQIQK